jgi:hypothetical protein
MVGVLVMAIIGGVISASVFVVIPWAQDRTAQTSLDAVRTAEGAHMGLKTKFGDLPALVTAKLLPSSPDIRVGTNAAGDCYVGVSRSATGAIYYQSDQGVTPKVYVSASSTSSCTNLQTLINPMLLAGGPGGATPIVNLATNPSFETPGPVTVVRTNLSRDPRGTGVGNAGWHSNNGTIFDTTYVTSGFPAHPLGITTAVRSSVKTGITDQPSPMSLYNIDTLGTSSGPRSIGVWVVAMQPGYKVNATYSSGFDPQPLTAGIWTYIKTTSTVAANDWSGLTVSRVDGLPASNTDSVYATGLIAEAGDQVGSYFDGATAAAGDFTYAWAGAANTSASNQRGVGVAGWTSENGASVIQTTNGDGTKSILMSGGGDSYMRVPMAAGDTFTFAFDYSTVGTLTEHFYGALWAGDNKFVDPPTVQPTPARYTLTTTTPVAGVANFMFAHAGGNTQDTAKFDNVVITKTAYTGPYFDGGSPGAHWLGAPNASKSVRY